jgi:hypothetical protein
LQEQQYRLAAEEYRRVNGGREFPLLTFSAMVFQMRLTDRADIPIESAAAELPVLEAYKLVYRRVVRRQTDEAVLWYFRHDKIVDFFMLQMFLKDPSKQEQYIGDVRFRGVYFLLAGILPMHDAQILRERLIEQAVESQDHTVSDGFIRALRGRAFRALPQVENGPMAEVGGGPSHGA